ncbi:MAG: LPS export ABC transporter permease LptG [Alphaproteobacteria bacterium]|nr:LPS export ABC transporter permease LptG [Alphaproteobacteria bacterium]
MKMTTTLSKYIAKRYVTNLLILITSLLTVVYIFDTIELSRRSEKFDDIPLSLTLQMGLFKLPEVGQTLFPFAVLFSAMLTFWQLSRRYELIVVRSSGFSVWQFLMPVTLVALSFGLLQMSVINPVGSVLVSKYEEMERTHLKRQKNQVAVLREGLWLRQPILIESTSETTVDPKPDLISGYIILHAQRVEQPGWTLRNITVMYFTDDNKFLQRIDAKSAKISQKFWQLENAIVNKQNAPAAEMPEYQVPTTLTVQDIEESFSSPESMSFWRLPSYIHTLEQTGFDATRLKVYYHNLLSQPLMFCAMILLAASVSMRPPRSKGTFAMIAGGVMIGFLVFFVSTFLQALGASQQIPVILAAWSPALIAFLLGLSVMMNLEDG